MIQIRIPKMSPRLDKVMEEHPDRSYDYAFDGWSLWFESLDEAAAFMERLSNLS